LLLIVMMVLVMHRGFFAGRSPSAEDRSFFCGASLPTSFGWSTTISPHKMQDDHHDSSHNEQQRCRPAAE
jgi:hypothetical protein